MGIKWGPNLIQIKVKSYKGEKIGTKEFPPISRNRRVGKMTVGTGTHLGVCQRGDTHKKSFAENGEGGDKKKVSLWGIPGNVRW